MVFHSLIIIGTGGPCLGRSTRTALQAEEIQHFIFLKRKESEDKRTDGAEQDRRFASGEHRTY